MDRRRKKSSLQLSNDIRKEIEKEKVLTLVLDQSCKKWLEIITEFENEFHVESDVEPGGTWKTRYAYQFLHNRMLRQQIKEMRTELRMLKHGQFQFPSDIVWEALPPSECRKHLKSMQIEITSLKGYKKSIEEKLDSESYAYNVANDKCESILNDVWFQQQTRIKDQEKRERQVFHQYKELRGKTVIQDEKSPRLPPITPRPLCRKESYKSVFDLRKTMKTKDKKKKKNVSFHFDDT